MSISATNNWNNVRICIVSMIGITEMLAIYFAGYHLSTQFTMLIAGGFTAINFLAFAIPAMKYSLNKDEYRKSKSSENHIEKLEPKNWPITPEAEDVNTPKPHWCIKWAAALTILTCFFLFALSIDSCRSNMEQLTKYIFNTSNNASTITFCCYGFIMLIQMAALILASYLDKKEREEAHEEHVEREDLIHAVQHQLNNNPNN